MQPPTKIIKGIKKQNTIKTQTVSKFQESEFSLKISEETQVLKHALQENYLKERGKRHNRESLGRENSSTENIEFSGFHLNPANIKIYKNKSSFSEETQQNSLKLSQRATKARQPIESKQQQRLSLPTQVWKINPRAPTNSSRKSPQQRTPAKRKRQSIQKDITCPNCYTKITKLIINTKTKEPRSPRILTERSLSPRENRVLLRPLKSQMREIRNQVFSELQQFQKFISEFESRISEQLYQYHNLAMEKQQEIFILRNKQLSLTNTINALTKDNQKIKTKLQESSNKNKYQNYDPLYEGRMQNFNERTQYTQNILLNSDNKKNSKVFQKSEQGESPKKKKTRERSSVAAEELDLLEKLLESHLIYNY